MTTKELESFEKKFKLHANDAISVQSVEDGSIAALYDTTDKHDKDKSYTLSLYNDSDNFANVSFFVRPVKKGSKMKYADVICHTADSTLDEQYTKQGSLALLWDTFTQLAKDHKLLAITGEVLDEDLKAPLKDLGFSFYTKDNDTINYGFCSDDKNHSTYMSFMEDNFGKELSQGCTF